jgi:two-component system sensor histidine kinase KdpD
MQKYRRDESIKEVWPAGDRIAICLGPSPLSARLVRATRRMAAGLHAEWIAVYVETPGTTNISDKRRERVRSSMRLAEELGGETVVLTGTNVADELITYARRRNCSKIVIGKPARPRWREILFGSVVDDVIRKSGEIDVYVITGDLKAKPEPDIAPMKQPIDYRAYFLSAGVVAITTILCRFMFRTVALVNLVMFYLLAVAIVAVQYGRGPSILASLLGVMIFDFMFIPPYFSFAVNDSQYLITLGVMLTVGLSLSTLTDTVRRQAILARGRERRTAALYRMVREQSHAATILQVLEGSTKHISEIFDCSVTSLLPDADNRLRPVTELSSAYEMDSNEFGVAQWVYMNGQMAGIGTSTLPGAKGLYLPLIGSKGAIGTIGILPSLPEQLLNPEERHFLETFVNNMALATERAMLSEELAKSEAAKSTISPLVEPTSEIH